MTTITLPVKEAAEMIEQLKGLAAHSLPGDMKFKIYENINALEPTAKNYVTVINDIIKEHGEPFRGQMMIREYIGENGDQPNPKAALFKAERDKIEAQTADFNLHLLPRKLFTDDREISGDVSLIVKHLIER